MDPSDYIGRKFGRLTVIQVVAPVVEDGKMRIAYSCICECGTNLVVKRHSLQNTRGIKSCGCLNRENRSKLGLSKRKYEPHIASAVIIHGNSYSDGDLTFDDFYILTQQNCHYCGAIPTNSYNKYLHRDKWSKNSQFAKDNGNFVYNGLDRIDSSKPHNLDNVVPCCFDCNMSKSDKSIEEFREWAIRLYDFWAKEKA